MRLEITIQVPEDPTAYASIGPSALSLELEGDPIATNMADSALDFIQRHIGEPRRIVQLEAEVDSLRGLVHREEERAKDYRAKADACSNERGEWRRWAVLLEAKIRDRGLRLPREGRPK